MRGCKRILQLIFMFIDKLQRAHIGAYAAQAAYFTVLSGIPLLMLLLTLVQYTPLTESAMLEFFSSIFPEVIMPFVIAITQELYTKSVTLISITAIVTIWSAARSVLAITAGFNSIYGIKETRNYFVLRFRSAFYTLLLLMSVVVSMTLILFSEQRIQFLIKTFPVVAVVAEFLGNIRFILVIFLELLMFMFIYKLVPNRKGRLKWQIPGALFAALGWSGFSYFFSLYFGGFSNMSYMYGSLTTVIMFMLWVYFCMYILLIGAGINACVERYPRWRKWENFYRSKKQYESDKKDNKK